MSFDFQVPQRQAPAEKVFPRFFLDKMELPFKSAEAGHPVFVDVEMVEVTTAGDTRSTWVGKVKDEHRQRWPQSYNAFKQGLEPVVDGMPLEQWPPMTPGLVANLKAIKIFTVEQLAGISDGHLQNIGLGGRQLRDKAEAWLRQAEDGKEVERVNALLQTERDKVKVLSDTVADLSAAVERLQSRETRTND